MITKLRKVGELEINLLPWRVMHRQKKREDWARILLLCLVLILGGGLGIDYYFDIKINELKIDNQHLESEYTHQKLETSETDSFKNWWADSVKNHTQLSVFLGTLEAAKNLKILENFEKQGIFFQEVRLDNLSPQDFAHTAHTAHTTHTMSWIGMTNTTTLQAWLTQISQQIPGKEIQLVDIKKTLGQVQFEAQV